MARLSRKDIESIASRIINDYTHLPRFAGQEVQYIDPIVLACELCGYSMDYAHLSRDGKILGLTSYGDVGVGIYDENWKQAYYFLDGSTFLIESSLKDDPAQRGRHNFTVMHETAHQILGRLFPDQRRTEEKRVVRYRGEVQRPPIQDWGEWQADNLASALLLPPNIVKSALCQFGLGERIGILNRKFFPDVYEQFSQMAEFLGASKQALAIRLKGLKLLEKEFLENPYDMIDVWKGPNEI